MKTAKAASRKNVQTPKPLQLCENCRRLLQAETALRKTPRAPHGRSRRLSLIELHLADVSSFVTACCITGPTYRAASEELWNAYLEWGRDKIILVSRTSFGVALRILGFGNFRGHTVTWLGLQLR